MGENQRLVLSRQLVRGGEPCGRGGLCGLGGDHSTPPVEREGRVPASGSGPASVWGGVWGSGWGVSVPKAFQKVSYLLTSPSSFFSSSSSRAYSYSSPRPVLLLFLLLPFSSPPCG